MFDVQIEVLAAAFPDEDSDIDARPYAFPGDPSKMLYAVLKRACCSVSHKHHFERKVTLNLKPDHMLYRH